VLAFEPFKMSLLRSLVRGGLFFYKDAAPTELKKIGLGSHGAAKLRMGKMPTLPGPIY